MGISFEDFAIIMDAICKITGVDSDKAMELFCVIADVLDIVPIALEEDETFIEAVENSDLTMEELIND